MPIKVAIVEDDHEIRNSLADLILGSDSFKLTVTCKNAADALKKLPKDSPEVVLMDINMPGMNGVECVRQLKTILPEVSILMLTVYEDDDSIFESLKAGASGYLLKRSVSKQILRAIKEVHEGGAPMTPQIASRVVRFFSGGSPRKIGDANEPDGLTDRQKEFLDLLAAGYVYKEIADKLGISMDGVRFHVRKTYEKLHVHSRTEAVVKHLKK